MEEADASKRLRELLVIYGERVHGPGWRSAVARTLGPFHPDGARDAIDQRLVSRWASGQRPIPQWAIQALGAQVEELAEAFREALYEGGCGVVAIAQNGHAARVASARTRSMTRS